MSLEQDSKRFDFKAFYFCMQCGFKLFGYKLGKNYDKLPKKVVLKCTMNKMYWEK